MANVLTGETYPESEFSLPILTKCIILRVPANKPSPPRTANLERGLELRATEVHEAQATSDLIHANLAEFARWFPWASPTYTPESFLQWFQSMPSWDEGHWSYTIYCDDQLVGRISLHRNAEGFMECGYWLSEPWVGRGLVSRSLVALEELVGELGITYAEIHVEMGNVRSRAVAERNGYREVRRVWDRPALPGVEHIVFGKNFGPGVAGNNSAPR